MYTLLPSLILFLLFLVWERVSLRRRQARIPLRIAVTGTRGKSSIVSLLAAVFREDGRRVLAKTTGSEALLILPDGSREEVVRSGMPSILEQKQLVRRAVREKADCLIAEIMSIQPENHFVESRMILQPHAVVITNVRRDHTEAMGKTEAQIASVLGLAICPGAAVFLPEAAVRDCFQGEARRCGATLVPVAPGAAAAILEQAPGLARQEFAANLDLVFAVASHFGIAATTILEGLRKAQHDIGGLKIWRFSPDAAHPPWLLINAFAANDPESTFQVMSRVSEIFPQAGSGMTGILNLRADRAARTLQWIEALKQGGLGRFRRLYVTGGHARVVRRRLPGVELLDTSSPEEMTRSVCSETGNERIVFGFGNIMGSGRLLVDYWNRVGTPCT